MKIGIIGPADYYDISNLKNVLKDYFITELVCGSKDKLCEMVSEYALNHEHSFSMFSSDYREYGKRAGIIRNIDIINNSDVVIIFKETNKNPKIRFAIEESIRQNKQMKIIDVK